MKEKKYNIWNREEPCAFYFIVQKFKTKYHQIAMGITQDMLQNMVKAQNIFEAKAEDMVDLSAIEFTFETGMKTLMFSEDPGIGSFATFPEDIYGIRHCIVKGKATVRKRVTEENNERKEELIIIFSSSDIGDTGPLALHKLVAAYIKDTGDEGGILAEFQNIEDNGRLVL